MGEHLSRFLIFYQVLLDGQRHVLRQKVIKVIRLVAWWPSTVLPNHALIIVWHILEVLEAIKRVPRCGPPRTELLPEAFLIIRGHCSSTTASLPLMP